MSYTYLQEQGEESSAESFADIPQFVLSRLNLTAEKPYSSDNETESCQSSPSGTMCKPSTEHPGEEKLTSSAEDFLAKTSAAQAKEQGLKDRDQVCGNTWRELSVKFDLATHLWKTHLCLWEEDLQWSSVTLPKWGMMLNGVCWEHLMPAPHTDETESGFLLPTPTCADATMGAILNDNTKLITLKSGRLRKISNQGVSGSIGLARTVAMWQTPTCTQIELRSEEAWEKKSQKRIAKNRYTLPPGTLQEQVMMSGSTPCWDWNKSPKNPKMYPTPTCHNAKECDAPAEATRNTPTLCHVARGGDKTQPKHLNPTWVEWLMGWPLEWTGLKPLEMDKFQQWLHSHGKF